MSNKETYWARFFNAEEKEAFEVAAERNKYIERAYERLTELSEDEIKRLEYEAREKAVRDHNYLMSYNLELGRKEGKLEGREEGRIEGIKAFIEIYQEDAFSREETADRLIKKFSLTSEKAQELLEKYWKN